jgi:DNA-binding NarL/FixJ family response regulator
MDNDEIRVLFAEGEIYYREFLQLTLERAGFQVVGAAGDSNELLEMARNWQPDVILLDIGMMANGAPSLLAALRSTQLKCRVILLSGSSNSERVARAIRLGASGWVSKRADAREITNSIRKVAKGRKVIPSWVNLESLAEPEEEDPSGTSPEYRYGNGLTQQEKRVLQLVADGLSTFDIADSLAVSRNTVKTHLRNIYCKLGVSGRTQAAVWALQNGWSP